MKKLIPFLLLGLGLVLLPKHGECASGVRGPKQVKSLIGSTNVVVVSTGAAVVYSVAMSTGTAGTDFLSLFDSATTIGLSVGNQTSSAYILRINASSTTQNTVVSFDPPLQFNSGIMAANSSAALTSVVTYERGRPSSGY